MLRDFVLGWELDLDGLETLTKTGKWKARSTPLTSHTGHEACQADIKALKAALPHPPKEVGGLSLEEPQERERLPKCCRNPHEDPLALYLVVRFSLQALACRKHKVADLAES